MDREQQIKELRAKHGIGYVEVYGPFSVKVARYVMDLENIVLDQREKIKELEKDGVYRGSMNNYIGKGE